jgi:hypothetical protein
MSRTVISTLLAVLAWFFIYFLIFGNTEASAEPKCYTRASLLGVMSKNFQEERVSIGMTSTGNMLEIYVSDKGTFTIVETSPNGKACVVVEGDNWYSHIKSDTPA